MAWVAAISQRLQMSEVGWAFATLLMPLLTLDASVHCNSSWSGQDRRQEVGQPQDLGRRQGGTS